MINPKINKILDSDDCFSCRVPCCRFLVKDRYFAPIFTEREMHIIRKKIKAKSIFKKFLTSKNVFQARLKGSKIGNYYVCPFLDEKNGACKIYDCRPLDCSLWPFVLVRKGDGSIFLSRMKKYSCPSFNRVSEEKLLGYIRYLGSSKMREKLQKLVKQYPALVWKYEKCFICLFKIL